MIVGYPGHFDVPAARRVARRRPIVFNPLVSLHDTLVSDRGRFRAGTPAAMVVRQIDRIAFSRSDVVVADTAAHARFFRETFALDPARLEVALVGAEDRLFRPGWQPPEPFHALFVGKLIPLHGLETILEAARLAPEVTFRIVGDGQLAPVLDDAPANVERVRVGRVRPSCPTLYQRAGCALGVFGTSEKAGRVIPNKAFQALACGAPLVTGDTEAARELLTDGEDARARAAGRPGRAGRGRATARRRTGARRRDRRGGSRPLRAAGERGGARRTVAGDPRAGARMSALLRPRTSLWLATAAFAAGFSALAVLQHRAFWTGRFDVGNLVQAVWSTAHGDVLEVTGLHGLQMSRLAAHFDPIVVAFAPLWWLWPDPAALLVVQALAVALGAPAVFLPRPEAPRLGAGRARVRARLPALPAHPVARRGRLPPGRVRHAAPALGRSGSSTRTARSRSRSWPRSPA